MTELNEQDDENDDEVLDSNHPDYLAGQIQDLYYYQLLAQQNGSPLWHPPRPRRAHGCM
jgi:hypothetical protein